MTALAIENFLLCKTPNQWIEKALKNIQTLLIDHAHCEKKAASAALHLIYKYGQYTNLSYQLSKLAREELRHFEMVLNLIQKRGFKFIALKSSKYADCLRQHCRIKNNNDYLVDILIINAVIEARSCERFMAIAPHLDQELSRFYTKLYRSEERHFLTYLNFAKTYAQEKNINDRISLFLEADAEHIQSPDNCFRFHSGT